MLFKLALALLAMWLLGVVGRYNPSDRLHILLLAGLMLLLLAFLKARDAAMRRADHRRQLNEAAGHDGDDGHETG